MSSQTTTTEEPIIACRNIPYVPQGIYHRFPKRIFVWLLIALIWLIAFKTIALVLNIASSGSPRWFGGGILLLLLIFGFSELIWGGGKEIDRSGMS